MALWRSNRLCRLEWTKTFYAFHFDPCNFKKLLQNPFGMVIFMQLSIDFHLKNHKLSYYCLKLLKSIFCNFFYSFVLKTGFTIASRLSILWQNYFRFRLVAWQKHIQICRWVGRRWAIPIEPFVLEFFFVFFIVLTAMFSKAMRHYLYRNMFFSFYCHVILIM